jgi:integrase
MAKRRAQGEGAIYQRESDGYWCTTITIGVIDGKRTRKTIYGKTRKEVVEKLKVIQAQQQQGVNIAAERMTIKQYLEYWLEEQIKPHRRPRTYRSYADTVRLHIVPKIGHVQLDKLNAAQVQAMINDLTKRCGARTTQYARAVLQRALNRAVKWDLVPRNVVQSTDPPRSEPRDIAPLSEAQARQLLDAVRGHRLEVLYRVALSLGLRRGEVLALRWDDVDFEQCTLRISGSLQREEGSLERTVPKSAASARTLALPPVLAEALQAHLQYQHEEQLVRGAEWRDHGLVFPSNIGTPMEPSNLNRQFKSVLKRMGLPTTIRFHDLRHSCATFLIAQGVHPRVVMEILGHSQISLTMNTYSHVLPETQREATKKVDALFGRSASVESSEEDRTEEEDDQEKAA